MKAWDWHFEASDGSLNCSGGEPFRSEAEAIKAGKRWQRETKRHGKITVKQTSFNPTSYIMDY